MQNWIAQLRGSFKVGFGQFATSKYPMFFTLEPKTEWDEYGEVVHIFILYKLLHWILYPKLIKPEDYKDLLNSRHRRTGKSFAGEGEGDAEGDVDMEEPDDATPVDNRPMKTVSSTVTVKVS